MKKILFVSPLEDPFTLTYGGSQRSNLLMRACAGCGEVDVICFRDLSPDIVTGSNIHIIYGQLPESPRKKESRLERLFRLLAVWRIGGSKKVDTGKEAVIDRFVGQKQYDWIVTRYMDQALSMGLLKYADRLVVDIDDSPVDKARDCAKTAATPLKRFLLNLYVLARRKAVRSFVGRVAVTFFSNPQQARQYHTRFLPNVPFYQVDIRDVAVEKSRRGRLLFVGLLSYYQNYLGVDYFLKNIYPHIKKDIDLEIHICGRSLAESYRKKWEALDGVRVLGFVENLSKEYSESEIVVIPLYNGAGTSIKVLEAMQMHRLVITTPNGIRGYDGVLTPGEDYLLARDDAEFIALVNEAVGNVRLQKKITEHAAAVVAKRYDKTAVSDAVKEALL